MDLYESQSSVDDNHSSSYERDNEDIIIDNISILELF